MAGWHGLAWHLGPPAGDADLHTTLEGSHPYESPPWSWLLLKRPVAYYFDAGDGYREILAIGNPLTWAAGVIGLVVLAVLWARGGWRVGSPATVVIVASIATYLPWLALQGDRSQVFLWYILPTIPFLYAGLGVLAAMAWRSVAGRTAVAALPWPAWVLLAFFFPLLTALPVSPDDWRARMWLTDCARPGAPTLEPRLGDQLRPAAGWLVLDLTDILRRSDVGRSIHVPVSGATVDGCEPRHD